MSPTPKRPRAELRSALIEAAARIVAAEGPEALTLRRVADDVGTSTMAVYTHFGGMDELRRAVRGTGYQALADDLAAIPRSGEPFADLLVLCDGYYRFAVSHPDLYRAMFMERPLDEQDAEECAGIFATLIEAVARCVEAGALAPGEPEADRDRDLGPRPRHRQPRVRRPAHARAGRGPRAGRPRPPARGPRRALAAAARVTCPPRRGYVSTRVPYAVAYVAFQPWPVSRSRTVNRAARRSGAGPRRSPSARSSPSARGGCGPPAAPRPRASSRDARPAARGRRCSCRRALERERDPRAPPAHRLADRPHARVERVVVEQDALTVGGHRRDRVAVDCVLPRAAGLRHGAQPVVPVAAAHAVAARAAVDHVVAAAAVEHVVARAAAELLAERSDPSSVSGPSPPRTRSNDATCRARALRRPRPRRGRR